MLQTYDYPQYDYIQSPEQINGQAVRHPLVIVGGGPVGLTMALDCAQRGIKTILIDNNNTVSVGSRAVCYAKRPLEIWDRLACGERMSNKGVGWSKGKVFFKDDLAYQFDLLPETGHKMPAMINLQQYYLEQYLVDKCYENPLIELRWKHNLISLTQHDEHSDLKVETPDGIFSIEADWLIACDGANSKIRDMVKAEFTGHFFQDRFLIADVVMKADYPAERWFWFDPPFHRNQSVLLHKQSDNLWRIDFQLGWDADPEEEKKTENILPRIKAMLTDPNSKFGKNVEFELEWSSIYQFACRRVDNFRYGRVLFAGDSAHQVSPFGARGANTGVQDADNLAWKLALIIQGDAPIKLIDTYNEERAFAADDNLLNSTRSTDFITPKTKGSRYFRDAILELAEDTQFAKPFVNSGRLSVPTPYKKSSLNSADQADNLFDSDMTPGTNCTDAPIIMNGKDAWLLNQLGEGFRLLCFGDKPTADVSIGNITAKILHIGSDIIDQKGLLTERFDGQKGAVYLIRPDQHVAARWREFDLKKIQQAIKTATCNLG